MKNQIGYTIYGINALGETYPYRVKGLNDFDDNWEIDDGCLGEYWAGNVPILETEKVERKWQPIETAPVGAGIDGSISVSFMMLAWGPIDDQAIGNGIRIGNRFYVSGTYYRVGDKEKPFEIHESQVFPTHWMETPMTPAEEANMLGFDIGQMHE